MADERVAIRIVVDSTGAVRAVEQVGAALGQLPEKSEQARVKVEGLFKAFLQANIVQAALGKLWDTLREGVQLALQETQAMAGLGAIARAFGQDADAATKAAQELARSGLISVGEAAAAMRNLLASGMGLPEAVRFIQEATKHAALFRQAHYSIGEAVVATTEGIKNLNSVMSDAVGVTTNMEQLAKKEAAALGLSVEKLNDKQKAYLGAVGMLKEMQQNLAATNSALNNEAAQLAQAQATWRQLELQLGRAVLPVLAEIGQRFAQLANMQLPAVESKSATLGSALQNTVTVLLNLVEKAVQGVTMLLGGIVRGVQWVAEQVFAVWKAVVTALVGGFQFALQGFLTLAEPVVNAFRMIAERAIDIIRDAAERILRFLAALPQTREMVQLLGGALEALAPKLQGLGQGAGRMTADLQKGFQDALFVVQEFGRGFSRDLQKLFDTAAKGSKSVVDVSASLAKQADISKETVERQTKALERFGAAGQASSAEAKKLQAQWERLAELAQEFGLTLEDVRQVLGNVPPEEAIQALREYGEQLESSRRVAERYMELQKRFAESLKVPPELIKHGFAVAREEAGRAAEDIARPLIEKAKAVEEAWQEFRIAVGQVLGGLIEDAARAASALVASLVGAADEASQKIIDFFARAGAAVGAAFGKAIAAALGVIGPVGQAIGTALGTIGGSLVGAIVTGIGKALGILKEPRWQRVMQSVGREWGAAISESLAQQIAKAAEEMAKAKGIGKDVATWAQQLLHAGDIIREVGISSSRELTHFAEKTRQILSVLDQGLVSTGQAARAIGDAFKELAKGLEETGDVGNRALIQLIRDVQNRGLKVAEIIEFINKELDKAAKGFGLLAEAVVNSTATSEQELRFLGSVAARIFEEARKNGASFVEALDRIRDPLQKLREHFDRLGIAAPEALQKLFRIQDLVEANKDVINAIEGVRLALEGLANVGAITFQDFQDAQAIILQRFDELIQKGFTQNEALAIIAPTLQLLATLARNYGFELDEATRKLIEQAQQQGLIADQQLSVQNILIEGFSEIIRLLGGEIPEAWKKVLEATRAAADEAGRYADEVRRARDELESMPAPGSPWRGEVGAQHGFFGVVTQPTRFLVGEAGPELVAVMPMRKVQEAPPAAAGLGPLVIQIITPDGRVLREQVIRDLTELSRKGRIAIHTDSLDRIR